MCGREDPLFTPQVPAARKGPISSKRVSSQEPFWENLEILASTASLNFHPNFGSQAPYLEIFSSQAPLFRGKCQFASPTLRKSGPHTPTWKKVECPPPPSFSLSRTSSFFENYLCTDLRPFYISLFETISDYLF